MRRFFAAWNQTENHKQTNSLYTILDDGSHTSIFGGIFPRKKNCFCVYRTETQYLLLGNNVIIYCLTFCGNKGSFPSFPVEILIIGCHEMLSY